jgi:branched-chain amino acid aminotransferase
MKAWRNGEFLDWQEVKVPVLSHGFGRGSAIFEVVDIVATEKGPAFLGLLEHVDRFINSATYMFIKLPMNREEIIRACIETAKENRVVSGIAKFFAYYSAVELDVVAHDKAVDVAVFCMDFGKPEPGASVMSQPVSTCISSYRKIHPESVPVHAKATGNYVGGYLAKTAAKEQGYDDVILLDTMGFVAEGATANLFIVKKDQVFTPGLRSVLPGINRMIVMDMLKDMGRSVRVTDIKPAELFECDEVFYTASVVKLIPISHIDNVPVGNSCPGPVTLEIDHRLRQAFRGGNEKFLRWLTHI